MFAHRLSADLFATQAMRRANVWRVASVVIEQFGSEAGGIASACASALDEMGDGELAMLWTRVGRAIAELERTASISGDRMN